ncbi:MAG: haloacid dehalogenase [Ahrensia sp.]|nr:haloacid dehalogenase [Ahrensia sp.]|tara:strand:- start:2450 stop:3133 length:684 start_codon:yes stop_codon:yes gene_type:complete
MSRPLLIFDCDGVLVDSEFIYLDVEMTFLRDLGVNVDWATYVREFMALGANEWRIKYAGLILRETGEPLLDAGFEKLKAESRRRVTAELKPVEGAEALLKSLTGPRCVASSTQLGFLHRKLDFVDFSRFFGNGIFSGDMVEHGKPAPDLFLHAAKAMGYGNEDCIVIEDSANGVRGGKAAGHFVIGFTGGSHCRKGHDDTLFDAGADIVLDSHEALTDWIAEELPAA